MLDSLARNFISSELREMGVRMGVRRDKGKEDIQEETGKRKIRRLMRRIGLCCQYCQLTAITLVDLSYPSNKEEQLFIAPRTFNITSHRII